MMNGGAVAQLSCGWHPPSVIITISSTLICIMLMTSSKWGAKLFLIFILLSTIKRRFHHNYHLNEQTKCLQSSHSLRCSTYRVSHKSVFTLFQLFSQVLEHIQWNFSQPLDSPRNFDSETHLTFHPTLNIDQVTAQNVRQTGF